MSAAAETRRLLLAGKTVEIADLADRFGVTQHAIEEAATKLRREGLLVHRQNGQYWLDAVPQDEIEERRSKAPDEHPALGSSLRVVRVELAGRRAITTLDDGVDEWVGTLVRRRASEPE